MGLPKKQFSSNIDPSSYIGQVNQIVYSKTNRVEVVYVVTHSLVDL